MEESNDTWELLEELNHLVAELGQEIDTMESFIKKNSHAGIG